MKHLFVFDGVDGAGKSTLISRVKSQYEGKAGSFIPSVHFPDRDILDSDLFKRCLSNRQQNKINISLVEMLIETITTDMYETIRDYLHDYDCLFIDRMMLSTFVYQCSYMCNGSITAWRKCIDSYTRLFNLLKQEFGEIEVYNFFLTKQLNLDNKVYESESQRLLDNEQSIKHMVEELVESWTLEVFNTIFNMRVLCGDVIQSEQQLAPSVTYHESLMYTMLSKIQVLPHYTFDVDYHLKDIYKHDDANDIQQNRINYICHIISDIK